jgi:predicted ATP-dependent endonuclease of OLD family
MKLLKARIQNFKSIDDSGWVDVDQVTCLVGKNESGKTAWVQALCKLNPVAGQPSDFDYELEYPRKRLQPYKRVHHDDPAVVVQAVFELTDQEVAAIEEQFGEGALTSRTVTLTKTYDNTTSWTIPRDETAIVKHLVSDAELPAATAKELAELPRVFDLRQRLAAMGAEPPQAAALLAAMDGWRGKSVGPAMIDVLQPGVPRFFYFDDYSTMEGRIAIGALKHRRDNDQLTEADRTLLALLDLVGEELEEFETLANQERLIASLEAAGNTISDEMFEFWSQNKNLKVEFRLNGPDPEAADPALRESNNLMVRIHNERHRVSVIFDERSRGFVWFFSFLAYFSELEQAGEQNLILMLDEPGLNLHATAQGDFLRFIEERLAPRHQVVFTTHSPFMVEPTRLERVRTVEDTDQYGTRVSKDVLTTTKETVFPLQAALGYQLAQTLFVGADNLLVEGPADYLYLQVLSQHLGGLRRTSLDPRWVIVPVGGLQNVPTFIALLHGQLNLAVMVDGSQSGLQRIHNMVERGLLDARQLLALTDITNTKSADLEDLFDQAFYLRLLKESGTATVARTKLGKGERIVKRVEEEIGGPFDHHRPARYLLEHPALLTELDETTLDNWERLITEINARLGSAGELARAA